MDTVILKEVIETTLTRRGSGRIKGDPVRIITQYWSKDGKLLAEVDPHPFDQEKELFRNHNETLQERIEQLEDAIKWALGANGEFLVPNATEKKKKPFWWRSELRRRADIDLTADINF